MSFDEYFYSDSYKIWMEVLDSLKYVICKNDMNCMSQKYIIGASCIILCNSI